MIFEAQIKEIKIKETVSNDREILIKLLTNDVTVLQLQKFISIDTVKVKINENE